jgi:tetratricopeptide (TPR) repeat protein
MVQQLFAHRAPDPGTDQEVVMKSPTASTLRPALWIALAAFLVAITAAHSNVASAQQLISYGHINNQEPPKPAASADLPVMTPELDADLLAARQHYPEAIAAYKKLTPQTAEIYNKIGMSYQRLSMNADARYFYDRAMRLDRKFAPAYNNVGTIEYHEKDNKHAERLYHRSIKLDPKVASYWTNLGAAYLAEKRYRDGAEAYQHAFTLDTGIFQDIALNGIHEFTSSEDMAKMYLCFAGVYAQAGLKDQAVEYLRKALLEGFHDKHGLQQDQQFASLHGDPAFEKLLGNQPQP